MTIITVTAALALAALLVWKIGAPVARFAGALMVVSSLAFIVLGDPIGDRLPWLIIGALVWLAGHFLAAYQHRFWRSRLAESIVTHTPLRYLDPVGGHEARTARAERKACAAASTDTETDAVDDADTEPVDHFAAWERELAADTTPTKTAPAKTTPARTPARSPRPVVNPRPSRAAVYGKRAAKAAGNLAARKVPGVRAARSAWRFVR
ncbi:hypothetical protein [Prescottella subtropica]|uniref:hypothetical protein n=1 Tax=Prescottella subtropica TaxID=2545757 RepID=UPI0010F62923|nr:hypothetical protein [Prescottella subtropica]